MTPQQRQWMAALLKGQTPDYGLGPMTADTKAGALPPELRGRGAGESRDPYAPLDASFEGRVAKGINDAGSLAGVPQAVAAWGDAALDPSIANLTDAGVKTGMAAFRPGAALGALGAGYGAAALKDAGFSPSAMQLGEALAAPKRAAVPEIADLPGLTPEQNSEYKRALLRIYSGDFENGAARRSLEDTRKRLEGMSDEFAKGNARLEREAKDRKAKSDQAEYDAAVGRADKALADGKAKAGKRFEDTAVGQVYDKTGIATPGLLAAGVGAISRAATGGGSAWKDYGLPALLGGGTGIATANYPKAHDVIFAPSANPEKQAYGDYARELPPTHPRKQEWTDYADKLPAANPVQEQASKEFYDPTKLAERSVLGLIEGLVGGPLGSDAIRIANKAPTVVGGGITSTAKGAGNLIGDAVEGAAALPGRASKAYNASLADALEASARRSDAGSSALDAAEQLRQAQQAAAEAARRSSGGTGGQQSAGPSSQPQQGGRPPQPGPSQNPPSPPDVSGGIIIPPGSGGQSVLYGLDADTRELATALIQRIGVQNPPVDLAPLTNRLDALGSRMVALEGRALPPPTDLGPLTQRLQAIEGGQADLRSLVEALKLPPPTTPPTGGGRTQLGDITVPPLKQVGVPANQQPANAVKPNTTHATSTSPEFQSDVLAHLAREPMKTYDATAGSQASQYRSVKSDNPPTTRYKDAAQNLRNIARENGINLDGPDRVANARKIFDALNGSAAFGSNEKTGNTLASLVATLAGAGLASQADPQDLAHAILMQQGGY